MPSEPKRRFQPSEAVRLGLSEHPLTDLYYKLMQGPWWVLVGLFFVAYIIANLAFAGLYQLDLEGIERPDGGFLDAFEFSVQTISTIGYGSMAPQTAYTNMLVTMEAMVGLLGFAIATGLMFQKFARPKSMVRFSEPLLIKVRNGKPTACFRLGNARGNEIIEASVRMVVLKPEVTEEGASFRRLHDLELMRSTSPMFVLTWTVMHIIDEDSPLYGETPESLIDDDVFIIVTMTGIDATFSQTIYTRHIYYADSIRFDEHFADMVERGDDGRLVIDYGEFDRSVPAPGDALALMAPGSARETNHSAAESVDEASP